MEGKQIINDELRDEIFEQAMDESKSTGRSVLLCARDKLLPLRDDNLTMTLSMHEVTYIVGCIAGVVHMASGNIVGALDIVSELGNKENKSLGLVVTMYIEELVSEMEKKNAKEE